VVRRAILLCCLFAGCQPAATKDPTADMLSGLSIQVGTGSLGSFRPLTAGQGLLLQRGCQGAQHIFTGVRVWGATGPLRIDVTILRSEDRALTSVPLSVRLPAERDPEDGSALRITGLTPVIEAPRDVLDRSVDVAVRVRDAGDLWGEGAMIGVVAWGPDSCGS
jgi:hypothetical protein